MKNIEIIVIYHTSNVYDILLTYRIMKIALFGGAFDPITTEHIRIAKHIVDGKIAEEVWLIPCYFSYHGKNMTDGEKRVEMCKIAVKETGNDKIKVCDY